MCLFLYDCVLYVCFLTPATASKFFFAASSCAILYLHQLEDFVDPDPLEPLKGAIQTRFGNVIYASCNRNRFHSCSVYICFDLCFGLPCDVQLL